MAILLCDMFLLENTTDIPAAQRRPPHAGRRLSPAGRGSSLTGGIWLCVLFSGSDEHVTEQHRIFYERVAVGRLPQRALAPAARARERGPAIIGRPGFRAFGRVGEGGAGLFVVSNGWDHGLPLPSSLLNTF